MTTTPEEQIWAVAEAIANSREIAPSGEALLLNPKQFSKVMNEVQLKQILHRLERDDKVIEIKSRPTDLLLAEEDGCYALTIPNYEKFREFLNRAHSRHFGALNKLAGDNFLAVCDVAMDICAELQLSKEGTVHIPIVPSIVRFTSLCPAKSVNLLDRYGDFRMKALSYMKERQYILSFELQRDMYISRWEQEISVSVDRFNFEKFYKKLGDVYEIRVVEPQKKNKAKAPKAPEMPQAPPVQRIEITSMPELQVRNAEDNTIAKGKKRIHLPKFSSTDWAKITWRFVDERNVVINAGKKEQVLADFESLGFGDDKRGKPNSAWALLLNLSRNNGETQSLPTPIPDSIKQHKKQVSDRLKAIFKNESDPFEDPTDSRTYRIKMALIPPAESAKPDELGVHEYLADTMTEEHEE